MAVSNSSILSKIEQRKSVHFNIKGSSHSALRIACFKNSISMQEFFDEISALVESESPIMISIMEEISEKKKSKAIKKLTKTDSDSLYNIIEKELKS